jgi:hypothetical protein
MRILASSCASIRLCTCNARKRLTRFSRSLILGSRWHTSGLFDVEQKWHTGYFIRNTRFYGLASMCRDSQSAAKKRWGILPDDHMTGIQAPDNPRPRTCHWPQESLACLATFTEGLRSVSGDRATIATLCWHAHRLVWLKLSHSHNEHRGAVCCTQSLHLLRWTKHSTFSYRYLLPCRKMPPFLHTTR